MKDIEKILQLLGRMYGENSYLRNVEIWNRKYFESWQRLIKLWCGTLLKTEKLCRYFSIWC